MKGHSTTIKAIPRRIGPKKFVLCLLRALAFYCLWCVSPGDHRKLSPLITHMVQLSASIVTKRR